MPINADAAFPHIEPHFSRTWSALTSAVNRYRQYPDLTIHRPTTTANVLNDLAWDEMVATFDDVEDARPLFDRSSNMRFISLNSTVLLWLKKVDGQHLVRIYPTPHAEDLLDDQAVFDFVPQASLIVVGYQLDPENASLKRVSFSPPCRVRPDWYVDLELQANVVPMRRRQRENAASRLRITRGARQDNLL